MIEGTCSSWLKCWFNHKSTNLSQTFNEELVARQEKPQGVGPVQRPSLDRNTSQDEEKARKVRLAQERRAKIMAQMSALQKAFIKENAELLASMETEEYVVNFPSTLLDFLLAPINNDVLGELCCELCLRKSAVH